MCALQSWQQLSQAKVCFQKLSNRSQVKNVSPGQRGNSLSRRRTIPALLKYEKAVHLMTGNSNGECCPYLTSA